LHSVKRLGAQRITTVVPTTSAFESSPSMVSTRAGGKSGRANGGGGKRSTPQQTAHGNAGHTTGGSVAVPATVSSGGVFNAQRSGDLLDVIRLRSLTMQMLRLGFDPDEVTSEARDELRFMLMELRFNARLNLSFNTLALPSQHQQLKEAEQDTSRSPSVIDLSKINSLPHTPIHVAGADADSVSFSSSSASLERRSFDSRSRSQSQIAGGSLGTAHHSSSLLLAPNVDNTHSSNLSDYASDTLPHSTGYLVRSGEVADVLSALSMTLSNVRLPGLDPVISEVFQQSPGYHDLAYVGIRASHRGAVNRRLSTSPLPSVRSETSCQSGSHLSKIGLYAAISSANASYEITQTYPCMLIVPSTFTKSRLVRVARSHRHGRFPIIVWQHADTRAFLLRGSAFQTKSIFSAMKHTATAAVSGSVPHPEKQTHDSDLSEISSTNEHARYFRALADLSPLPGFTMTATSFADTPRHPPQRCDDSGLSATQSSATSPSLNAETVSAASPSEVVLRRPLPTDQNADFLRATRASSKAAFGSIVSLVNPQTRDSFDSAVGENQRFSFYFPEDETFSLPQFVDSTSDSVTSFSGQQSARQFRYKPQPRHSTSGARLTSGAFGKLSGGRASHTKHAPGAQPLNNEDRRSVIGSSTQHLGPTENHFPPSLYVLTEGAVKPLIKSGQFPGVEFVSVEYATHSDIRDAFQKLYKACLPKDSRSRLAAFAGMGGTTGAGSAPAGGSAAAVGSTAGGGEHEPTEKHPGTDASKSADIFIAISESGWLTQVQSLLQLAGVVVDVIGFQGASVAVCLEDGWDAVTQVVSLAQVMMDPTYRTIRGFWSLIEKEWLMFGHCFNHRVGQKSSRRSKNVSPVFLQFLDAVHQLLCQFPLSFEFNDFFLQFLAYHHMSNRFHEFKYDCEYERLSHWFNLSISAPIRPDLPADGNFPHTVTVPSPTAYEANSIWSFIQAQHEEWPIFFNFFYSPERAQKTLIPVTSLVSLDIWKYYLNEDLATGPVYDLDLFCPSYRKQTTRNYDPVLRQGYNNTHVEQTYAVLGLREGEDAVGWREAWAEVNLLSAADSPLSETAKLCTDLPLLSEEATADFDRILLQLPHGTTCRESCCSCPPPNASTQAPLNTTLKPPPPSSEGEKPAKPLDYASHSSSRTDIGHPPISSARSNCNFRGEVDSASYFSHDDVRSMSSEEMAVSVNSDQEEEEEEGLGELSSARHMFVDECTEARQAVLMQHRAATMRRLNKVNKAGPGTHAHQASTLVVTGSEDYLNSSRYLQASGSLSALPIAEDTSEPADALFEKPHKFERLKTTLSMSRCDWCQSLVLATSLSRGVVRCADCHLYCHEKCAPLVPRTCRGTRASHSSRYVPRGSSRSSGLPGSNTTRPWNHTSLTNRAHRGISPTSAVASPSSRRNMDALQPRLAANGFKSSSGSPVYAASLPVAAGNRNLSSSMAGSASSSEYNGMACGPPSYAGTVAYSSELYKLGHRKMLPTWKPRFFVLDTERHQLRYYDTAQDEVPRGCIDLQDVRSVKLIKNVQSGQRRFHENATFEVSLRVTMNLNFV
uniref:Myotubularin phosphatase domain-containing protein n=1 Tax=Schistocephalus solidus TaxID=70667 RepID=A0A183SX77_SCHSO